jgi:Ca2+/Na+ antiporter
MLINGGHAQDPIVGGFINSSTAFNGWWIIFWFIFMGLIVVLSSLSMSRILHYISEKSKLSVTFIGGVMLVFSTAWPEIIQAVYSGINNQPVDNLFHYYGASTLTSFTLIASILFSSTVFIVFARKTLMKIKIYNKKWNWESKNESSINNYYYAELSQAQKGYKYFVLSIIITDLLFLISLSIPTLSQYLYIPGIRLSIVSLFPLATFILFLWYSIKTSDFQGCHSCLDVNASIDDTKNKKRWEPKSIKQAYWLFGFLTIFIVITSYILNIFVSVMAKEFNMGEDTAVGVFLVLVDELPEIIGLTYMIFARKHLVAVGGILGCHLLKGFLVFTTDITNTIANPDSISYFSTIGEESLENAKFQWKVIVWSVTTLLLSTTLYSLTIPYVNKNIKLKTFILSMGVVIYIAMYAINYGLLANAHVHDHAHHIVLNI